jgi:hypothetical protein
VCHADYICSIYYSLLFKVTKLNGLGIPADLLTGKVDDHQQQHNKVFDRLRARPPGVKLLYVTPERVTKSNKLLDVFKDLYAQGLLDRFVIDEAHCVSQVITCHRNLQDEKCTWLIHFSVGSRLQTGL